MIGDDDKHCGIDFTSEAAAGAPPSEQARKEAASASKTAISAAIGNSMSVNVLQRLLPRVAFAAGILLKLPTDPWDNCAYKHFE